MKIVFADRVSGVVGGSPKYNVKLYEVIKEAFDDLIKVNCSAFLAWCLERDLLFCPFRYFRLEEIKELLFVGTPPVVAGSVLYGGYGLMLPHLPTIPRIMYQSGDMLDFYLVDRSSKRWFRWHEFVDFILKEFSGRKVFALVYYDKEGELIRSTYNIDYHVTPGPVETLNFKGKVEKKYDVVINYEYWKTMSVKPLKEILDSLRGLKVAVHNYMENQTIKRICRKFGVDWYGRLPRFEDYIKLYASSKLAYMISVEEGFGFRLYEVGQITPVFTSFRHYDEAFTRIKPEELRDFITGFDVKESEEYITKVKESIRTKHNPENFIKSMEKVPELMIKYFPLEKVKRWW